MSNTKNYYSAKELAEELSLNVMTIYRYISAGKLKAYKIGKEPITVVEETSRTYTPCVPCAYINYL